MAPRSQGAMGTHKARTQEAPIAALLARLRTTHCATERVVAAGTPFFSGLLGRRVLPRPHWGKAVTRAGRTVPCWVTRRVFVTCNNPPLESALESVLEQPPSRPD